MQTDTQRTSGSFQSPVDDQLYNLMQALVSKCEAIEAYSKYEQSSQGEGRSLFQTLGQEEVRHAEQLLDAVRTQLNSSGQR